MTNDNVATSGDPVLLDRLAAIEHLLVIAAAAKPAKDEPKPRWWVSATQFLGLPAILILMVMQFTQAASNVDAPEKTRTEIERNRADTLKTRIETQQLLEKVEDDTRKGVARSEIVGTINQLQARIHQLEARDVPGPGATLLERYILLWVVYLLVNLALEILGQGWSTLTTALTTALYTTVFRDRPTLTARQMRRRDLGRRLAPFIGLTIGPVFSVFAWSVRLSVFITLVIPLFDAILATSGVPMRFGDIVEPLLRGDIAGFLARAKIAIYSGG